MLFHKRTFPRWLILIPIMILIGIGGVIGVARGRPTVIGVFPAPDTVAVPGLAPVRLTFSRPMNQESVEQNLRIEPDQPGEFAWSGNTVTFTPQDLWPPGAVISVTLGTARSSLGIPVEAQEGWSFSVARTMLAYLWPADGSANLYMLDPLQGDVVQLTERGGVFEFAVRADGLQVFFSAENGAGGSALWQLDMLTREPSLVLDCADDLCAWPQPSPDGRWLAYENTTQNEVRLRPLTGGEELALGSGTRPLWSSEGNLAYYDGSAQAFKVVNPDGTMLADFPNQLGEPGAWSPDGSFFIAPDADEAADASRLFCFFPINRITNDISGEGLVEDTSPAYSPDGQWLAFARKYLDAERWTPGRQLWIAEVSGENAGALTDEEFFSHASFAWSPDSQTIAFVRAHRTAPDIPPELWIIGRDGSAPIQLVVGGYAPQWIP